MHLLRAYAASAIREGVEGGQPHSDSEMLRGLEGAEAALERMQAYAAGAVTLCAALASYPVPSVTIPKKTFGLDVVPTTGRDFRPMPFHDKIVQATDEAHAAAAAIAQMHCHASGEAAAAVALAVMKRVALQEARTALGAIRDSIFERVIAEG